MVARSKTDNGWENWNTHERNNRRENTDRLQKLKNEKWSIGDRTRRSLGRERSRNEIIQRVRDEIFWEIYVEYKNLFNNLSLIDKKLLQKIIWIDSSKQDWIFWKDTFTHLSAFIEKNYKWKTKINLLDVINNHKSKDEWLTDNSRKKSKKDTPEQKDNKRKNPRISDESNKESNEGYIIKTVKATAYYWPLKWQRNYATWSYERDLKLQWTWVRTASWVRPKPWMIAAPKGYDFWTKVILPTEIAQMAWAKNNEVTIQDRWGAIRWNRVDIFFWYWDEALERALKFWKRNIQIKIENNSNVA